MQCFRVVASLLVCPIAIYVILTKRNANLKKKPSADIGEMPDIISGLPDDILVSIMSRLSLEDAIRTSILSRSWRNRHRFVPVVVNCDYLSGRFDPEPMIVQLYRILRWYLGVRGPRNSKWIITKVHRFLSSRSRVHSIRLEICLNKTVTQEFELCINHLARLGVEELALTCSCPCTNGFGDPNFSIQIVSQIPSLRYLRLNWCYLRPNMTSQCTSIQTLDLSRVTFLPGAIECILSNCLMIHKLILWECKFPSKCCFSGPNLQLEYLGINVCIGADEIEFYAANLVLFEFTYHREVKFIFDFVPRLQTIYINSDPSNILPYVGGRLAKNLPHLKSLHFSTKDDMFKVGRLVEITMFDKLKQLNIRITCRGNINLLLLISFLQSCPLLEEFHVYTQFFKYDEAQWGEDQPVVLHPMLKEMEICGFGGTESEIVFALHILKIAINLEKMVIGKCCKKYAGLGRWFSQYGLPWSEETNKKIHQRLEGQAVSKIVQLVIQDAVVCDCDWDCDCQL